MFSLINLNMLQFDIISKLLICIFSPQITINSKIIVLIWKG